MMTINTSTFSFHNLFLPKTFNLFQFLKERKQTKINDHTTVIQKSTNSGGRNW